MLGACNVIVVPFHWVGVINKIDIKININITEINFY